MAALPPHLAHLIGAHPLVIAAVTNDTDQLEELLENDLNTDADVHEEDEEYVTPFLHAVMAGHVEAAEVLLGGGASIERTTTYKGIPNLTAYLIAARRNDAPMLRLLNRQGALTNIAGGGSEGPNYDALDLVKENSEAERVLIATNKLANLAQHDIKALDELFGNDHDLKTTVEINNNSLAQPHSLYHEMWQCTQAGAHVNQRSDDSSNSRSLLHLAVSAGKLEAVVALLDLGADIDELDSNDMSPLMLAILKGSKDNKYLPIVQVLIEKHATFPYEDEEESAAPVPVENDKKQTCLMLAINNLELFRYLVEVGHVPVDGANSKGVTPLMYAAIHGKVNIIQYLLENSPEKPNINKQDRQGCSTLMHAILKIKDPAVLSFVVMYLVRMGANIESTNKKMHTPLDLVYQLEDQNLMLRDFILKNLAVLDFARGTHKKLNIDLKMLTENGAIISVRGMERNSLGQIVLKDVQALHLAIRRSNEVASQEADVRTLLSFNADPNARDGDDLTPIDHACYNKLFNIAALCLLEPLRKVKNQRDNEIFNLKNKKEMQLKSVLENDMAAKSAIELEFSSQLSQIENHFPKIIQELMNNGIFNNINQSVEKVEDLVEKLMFYYYLGKFTFYELEIPMLAEQFFNRGKMLPLFNHEYRSKIDCCLAEMTLAFQTNATHPNFRSLDAELDPNAYALEQTMQHCVSAVFTPPPSESIPLLDQTFQAFLGKDLFQANQPMNLTSPDGVLNLLQKFKKINEENQRYKGMLETKQKQEKLEQAQPGACASPAHANPNVNQPFLPLASIMSLGAGGHPGPGQGPLTSNMSLDVGYQPFSSKPFSLSLEVPATVSDSIDLENVDMTPVKNPDSLPNQPAR